MNFFISTENGSGMSYNSKEDFLKEMDRMVFDCMENGGTFMDLSISADASCFAPSQEDLMQKVVETWSLSSYNEGTDDQLDYYINERKAGIGDLAYLYNHEAGEWFKMKILKIIRRSDDPKKYEKLLENEDVLLDGEDEYNADTSAEFITDNDSYLVWFKDCDCPEWISFSEEGPWDDKLVAVITKEGLQQVACYKVLNENDAEWFTPEGRPFNHEVVKWRKFCSQGCNFCNLKLTSKCDDFPSLRRITHREFENLKSGDAVFIKFGDNMYQAEVLGKPFYNSDADEPDWEVETDNGFCDEASLYILSHNSANTEDGSIVKEESCLDIKEYLEFIGESEKSLTLDEFEALGLNYWNYPLTEIEYLIENRIPVVLVRFPAEYGGYDYRFCEVPSDAETGNDSNEVFDRTTAKGKSEFCDFVNCNNCGKLMLVDLGTEDCPECGGKGCLSWKEAGYEEIDRDNVEAQLAKSGYTLATKEPVSNRSKVKIPNGYLMVEEKGSESEYPGVFVSFSEDGESYEYSDLIACVEYDSSSQEIQTVVYRKGCDEPNNIIYYADGSEV